MACVSKIGSLYEMVTKNVIVSTTNTVFGINPRAWIALPCEGLILLKIRQVVPTAGSALPVQIAVPANSTVSTVGADTCCSVTGVNVVNPINVAVTGAAMVNGTERSKSANVVMKWRTGNTGGWVTNPTRPITMETTDTTVTDLRCVEVADVAEVVLIEEQTQRIQLIRNM